MMAGADFIQDIDRQGSGERPLCPYRLTMVRAIRDYAERTGMAVGFKAAGGIRTAKHVAGLAGDDERRTRPPWLEPSLFRFGASGMLADIERQLSIT